MATKTPREAQTETSKVPQLTPAIQWVAGSIRSGLCTQLAYKRFTDPIGVYRVHSQWPGH